jgi:uncharacterized protein YacL
MIQALTRFIFVIAGLLGGYAATRAVDWQAQLGLSPSYVIFLFVILGGALGYVIGGIVGRELTIGWQRIEARLSEVAAVDVALGTAGLVVGLVIAFFLGQPLRLLKPEWLALTAITVLTLVCANVGITIAMGRRHDAIRMFPGLTPADDVGPSTRVVLLDTSAVIDGRFTELRRAGFIPGTLRVPRFVLAELQTLADSADDNKRSRGRRGLDLLGALPDYAQIDVMEVDYSDIALVDEKLMRLASDSSSVMLTVDFNLTKVARVRGIDVLNLNEAAAALRPTFLPGDTIRLALTRAGKEAGQAVGYLEDGTMVVAAEARDRLGTEADLEVTSVLQTSGGRMIFAKLAENGATDMSGTD